MGLFDLFKKKGSNALPAVVASLAKNEIIMQVEEEADTISPNSSKIGGDPWLPKDFAWPVFAGLDDGVPRPLSFLCQIDLSEMGQYDRDGVLPEKGMLYFFYECEAFRWGFDPRDKGSARVFYYENTEDFVPIQWPQEIDPDYVVPEMAVRFTARPSYPEYEELEFYSSEYCDWEKYDALLEKMGVDLDAEEHKLLGYADIIQNEMLSECERVTRGLYCGNPEAYENTPKDTAADISANAKDWTLLLQLTTLEKDGWEWMWGDCGMLYFYIKKQDLAASRFENAWFALQCS